MIMLSTPLSKNLLRTTDNYINALAKGGIKTVADLIFWYPRDYEDRTEILKNFTNINVKEKNTVLVTFISIDTTKTANGKILSKAVLEDENELLAEAVWFNQKYLATTLRKHVGQKVIVTGKVKYAYGKITFQYPEIVSKDQIEDNAIVPVYPDVQYIPGKWIAGKMDKVKKFIPELTEVLPEEILKKYNFMPRAEAIMQLHFPTSFTLLEVAKRRMAYEELYEINYRSISSKYENFRDSEGKALGVKLNPERIKEIFKHFPYELTGGQKIALYQILQDMEKSHAMQRLLEGDVGTGKTIVAFIASVHYILEAREISQKNGNPISPQVAIMAPTEILARQHFEGMQDFLANFGLISELLVGSLTQKQKNNVKAHLKSGQIDIIIGTHALVQETVIFKNLGFVIIDEQHRFGVHQRGVLGSGIGNASGLIPHNLNMTATPIPRTLALTLYGDQDLSIISEYPKGRKKIYTKVVRNDEERHQIELFVRDQLEKGRQAYWISPLVEESEKMDLANATQVYESLVDIFAPHQVGLLHGKMRPKDKDEIMNKFAEGEIKILSSTSVVEVGVNVPNATIMCIEGAERFGLSQLHQFRGRVGRAEHQSYCYLFPTNKNATERLRAMEQTGNGFELSEIDLELRGPGEVYGVKQSGLPDLRLADITDLTLVSEIRADIEEMFEKDSE